MKHNWVGLMSDINCRRGDERYWYECSNCHKETEHTKISQPPPSENNCKAKVKGSVFPLSSI